MKKSETTAKAAPAAKTSTKKSVKAATKPLIQLEYPIEVQINKKQILRVVSGAPFHSFDINESVNLLQESSKLLMDHQNGVELPEGVDTKSLADMMSVSIKALRLLCKVEIVPVAPVSAPIAAIASIPKKKVIDTEAKKQLAKKVARQGGRIISTTPVKTTTTKKVPKSTTTAKQSKPTTTSTTKNGKFKPYGKFGFHGHNVAHTAFKQGDKISFDIKGQSVVGEFVHVHVNNHSPNGYVVIKYDGKIYERVLGKVYRVAKATTKKGEAKPVNAIATTATK